ncbi:MAG: HipA domain-containing protein [Actinomycetes bacterium]
MSRDELAVWLYGERVAIVDRERGRIGLRYTEEALARHDLGSPVLSLSLPVSKTRFTQGSAKPFLDGLLPEGEPRRAIARRLGLGQDDTFGLIEELGRDCAGAVVFQPPDAPPPPAATTATAEPIDEARLAELVSNLQSAPLGSGGRVRVSLAGVQEKLLLTRMPGGSWGLPVDGTPSTHILKPEIPAYPHTVDNEAFCMRVAKHLGLDVASVETTEVAGRKLLVVERFDREVSGDGTTTRLHQEDFCQAVGMVADRKYEEDGGPSLRRIAEVVQAVAAPGSLEQLLRATTVNALIGNGDAHAKNLSLLHKPTGIITLAPLYDLLATAGYGANHLAIRIDNVLRLDRLTAERVVNEAAGWGLPRGRAAEVVAALLEAAPAALESARDETPGLPDSIFHEVEEQLERLESPS